MDPILAIAIGASIAGCFIGFAFGFTIAKEHNPIVHNDLHEAKEILQNVLTWFVYPLKRFNFTEDDKKQLQEAEDFIQYLETKEK